MTAKERARHNTIKRMLESPMLSKATELFCPNGYTQEDNKIVAQKKEGFNIYTPREWQIAPIRDIVLGRDVIIQAKVGSGKGTIIENSISNSGEIGYICAPTIALCIDMKKRLEERGAKVCLWSSVSTSAHKKDFRENPQNYNAIVFAPESIDTIHIVPSSLLFIDEAHNISMSSSYREAFSRLGKFYHRLRPKSLALLSATIDDEMIKEFNKMFFSCNFIQYRDKNPDRENIKYYAPRKLGYSSQEILELLRENAERGRSAIIYTFKTSSVDNMAISLRDSLTEFGYETIPFHSKVTNKEEKMKTFATKKCCVIATSAFGEGIDKKDIGLIIRFGFPFSITQLVQEAGRIERGGEMDGHYYMFRLGTEKAMFSMNKLRDLNATLRKISSSEFREFKYENFMSENTALTFFLKHGIIKSDTKVNPFYEIKFSDKDFSRQKAKGFLSTIKKKEKWTRDELSEIDDEFVKHLRNAKKSGVLKYESPSTTTKYKKVKSELSETDMNLAKDFNDEVMSNFDEITEFFECEDKKQFLKEYYE